MINKCLHRLLLSSIRNADDTQINEIIDAVTARYAKNFPDWEILFLSLPKHDQSERLRIAEYVMNFVKNNPQM